MGSSSSKEPRPKDFWSRVSGRTRSLLSAGLRSLSPPLSAGYYEELEELLISADLGPAMAAKLAADVRSRSPRTRDEAVEALVAAALAVMSKRSRELELSGDPGCVLMYGVNGAGKTTTIGKLAHRLRSQGRTPLIVAADTYRAAGIEQMVAWAERAGVAHFDGSSGADPASVVFDGVQAARRRGCDVVVVDTAGRLQTQRNLLEELAKVGRITARALDGAHYESILVLDAVLGLTSLVQARAFNQAIPMTGLVLAKLDSSAKGGAVIAIESELDMPVKLAGVGEGIDDLIPFEPASFIRALFQE
ncbi:MAG: signal recognition particle-docking protein FtsY [Chloroflexi bacterium]|nr:MAG: signal recognition particle-docking protein FtsY [Chloroflexota bacterium]